MFRLNVAKDLTQRMPHMPKIQTAMILAAGRGTRMGALTDIKPKPLMEIKGKTLLHYICQKLAHFGVTKVVVNTAYKGQMIKDALKNAPVPVVFSDEEQALETGGGVKNALPLLLPNGKDGLFVINADALWDEPTRSVFERLEKAWNPDEMDMLLAMVPKSQTIGDYGKGNYFIENNRLRRIRPDEKDAPYFYMGVHILHPRIFEQSPDGFFSLRDLFDKAQSNKRLGYVIHDGSWYHVGTPQALQETNDRYMP